MTLKFALSRFVTILQVAVDFIWTLPPILVFLLRAVVTDPRLKHLGVVK